MTDVKDIPKYAWNEVPEICPDCDSSEFISAGPVHLECYRCRLTHDLDKSQAEVDRLTKRIKWLEENPAVGMCVFCRTTIWKRQERIEDERGLFHPICGVKARAEAAEQRISELTSANEELTKERDEALANSHHKCEFELLARLERMQKALKTLNSRWGVRSGECYTCDLRHGKHSSDCPIPEIKSLLAEALEEKP